MPSLERCSGLMALPSSFSQEKQEVCLSSLHKLIIHDCPSLMISRPLPPSANIRKISIKGKLSINIDGKSFNIKSNDLSVLDYQILAFHNLRGMRWLDIWNCPNLISISSEGFSQLTGLVSLSIRNCSNLFKPPILLEAALENSSFGNIPTLPSLKHLNISSSGIPGGWLTNMLPHLRSLEKLSLRDCPQIKWLWISQPTEMEGSNGLASAVTLSAEDQILKVPSNILCSLKQLTIYGCVDLDFCGGKRGFGGFNSLEVLDIYDCPKLGPFLASGTNDDDTSNVDVGLLPSSLEVLSLSHLPENLQSHFPKGLTYLRYLSLMDSPCLKCVQLHSCTALEELRILRCEQLGALEGLQFLTSLRRLTISRCQHLGALEGLQFLSCLRSLEIETNPKLQDQEQGGNYIELLTPSIDRLDISNLTNNVQSGLLPCLPAITKLGIWESPELTSLQLGYCKALTELSIRHCESLASLQLGYCMELTELEIIDCESLALIEGLQSIPNLMSFIVAASSGLPPWMELLLQQQGTCEIWSRLKRLEIIGDASVLTMSLCKQLTSLQYLDFWGKRMSPMVSLTEEQERALQLLTFLRELHFGGYPNLLLLPADLRSLVSLKSLRIYSCPSISGLPEMPASCDLYVHDCSEELAQRFKEWELRRREMIDDEIYEHVWSEELAQQLEVRELRRMEMIVDEIVNH